MTAETQRAAAAAGTAISPERPFGATVRFDAEFETLKLEIDKLSSVGGGEIDWRHVVAHSMSIVESKSKDLLVAAYLCLGLFMTDGYAGLAEGLDAVRGMTATFWDGLFPEKPRARAAVAQWLAERLVHAIRTGDTAPGEAAVLASCVERTAALDALLGAKLAGDAPSLAELRGVLEEKVSAAAPAPGAASTAPADSRPPAAAAARVSRDLSSPEALDEALKETLVALRPLASRLRETAPTNPLAYRLARVAAWGRVAVLPPHTDGRTRVPPAGASEEFALRLNALADRGEWLTVLHEAEKQSLQSVLWLDLQYQAHRALAALGPSYDRARQSVRDDVAALVRALPGLLELQFESGLPFASDLTRAWLLEEVLAPPAGKSAAPTSAGVRAVDDELDAALEQARERAGAGRTAEAAGILAAVAASAPAGRKRFVRRLALARLLWEGREARLAAAQLEALDDDVRAYRLEEWDPALAVEALRLALACQRALARGELKGQPDAQRRVDDLHARLARLDPAAAMELKP